MTTEASPQNSERFQTAVTVLIALVSTAIALVAAQAAVYIGNTTEAQHNAVLAKINQERADGGTRVQLFRNWDQFYQYRFKSQLATLTRTYASRAENDGLNAYGTRLRLEAATVREESDLAFDTLDWYYLQEDEVGTYTGFDTERFIADQRQSAEVGQHLDLRYDDNFAAADLYSQQALGSSVAIIALFVSVMFLTWAQITRSALRWVWLLAGVGVAALVAGGFIAAWLLGWIG